MGRNFTSQGTHAVPVATTCAILCTVTFLLLIILLVYFCYCDGLRRLCRSLTQSAYGQVIYDKLYGLEEPDLSIVAISTDSNRNYLHFNDLPTYEVALFMPKPETVTCKESVLPYGIPEVHQYSQNVDKKK